MNIKQIASGSAAGVILAGVVAFAVVTFAPVLDLKPAEPVVNISEQKSFGEVPAKIVLIAAPAVAPAAVVEVPTPVVEESFYVEPTPVEETVYDEETGEATDSGCPNS
ncbi:hypothetical protein [Salinibacterium sp.]|uniref:hypothetical protein n=1 Tax=Salinibacterium sp. TaxID=1915057 RepID=UPI00286CAE83|nr:hypothetical protein [Salinibacterium sp.]